MLITTSQAARQRAARAIEAAASRQKTTFKVPSQKANGDDTPKPSARVRRRVSLGVAVDAVTGEVVKAAPKRKSRRESTVLSSQQTHSRMKDAENKRVSLHNYLESRLSDIVLPRPQHPGKLGR